ncbi:MAG TPA: cysteine synthase family protein [Vicinamibacteria bacterium]|nr:cysteine synthase family protein [Vicinamibacteria bacterium]
MHLRVETGEAWTDASWTRHPLLERIGWTPLVELCRIPGRGGPRVFAKVESANPGGSVKDRAARAIVTAAFRTGALPGKRLLDSTSGNTGIAYAMLGAALDFGVTLCVPASASPERLRILRAYGADVVETDPLEGSDGAILRARALLAERPGRYHYADQYSNPENPAAHERTTGPEILDQLDRLPLDLFAAGLGTSGTFVGVSRFLRRASPATRLVSVEPDAPFHGLEGLKHMATAIVPAIYDPTLADARVAVRTEEAHEMTRRLCREEGLFVGPSSGAAVAAALRAARESGAATVAVVLPDGGDRYLSDRFWGAA